MSLIAGRGCRWPPRRDSVSPCAPLSGGRDTHDGHENSPILVFFSNLLERVADWINQITQPARLAEELRSGQGTFDNFPHYRTFGEQGPLLVDLDRERVHAMSNLTAWTVFEAAEYIAEHLSSLDLDVPRR